MGSAQSLLWPEDWKSVHSILRPIEYLLGNHPNDISQTMGKKKFMHKCTKMFIAFLFIENILYPENLGTAEISSSRK